MKHAVIIQKARKYALEARQNFKKLRRVKIEKYGLQVGTY